MKRLMPIPNDVALSLFLAWFVFLACRSAAARYADINQRLTPINDDHDASFPATTLKALDDRCCNTITVIFSDWLTDLFVYLHITNVYV